MFISPIIITLSYLSKAEFNEEDSFVLLMKKTDFFMTFNGKLCCSSHSTHSDFYQLAFLLLVEGELTSCWPPLQEIVRPPMSVFKFAAISVSVGKFWLYTPSPKKIMLRH